MVSLIRILDRFATDFRPIYEQLLAESRSSGSNLDVLLSNDRLPTPLSFIRILDRF